MRVLHLIDADSPQATATTLALLGAALGRLGSIEQKVLLLGGSALIRAASQAGLAQADDVSVLGVPFGRALLGWPAVRRRVAAMGGNSGGSGSAGSAGSGGAGGFDLIHCWSGGALSLATLAFPTVPRVMSVTHEPSVRAVHWFGALRAEVDGSRHRGSVFLPISSTLRRTLLCGGIAEDAVHVLRPGIDLARVQHGQRSALRRHWAIAAEEDRRTKVIALLSDPPQRADARQAAMTIGIAEIAANLNVRLLVHPDQHRRRQGQTILRETRGPGRLIQEPNMAAPWSVLAGCDAALACGPAAGGLSLLWAMAANVPIVGEATYAISEIVEDRHSALLAKPGQQKELVKRLTKLIRDEQLAYKLRDTARHEAYSFFSRQRYCQSLQSIYQQIDQGLPVQVPEMQVTGGLRFTGRA